MKKISPRREAIILASLQDYLMEVRLGYITLTEWRQRAQDAVDRGVTLTPSLQRMMRADVFWSETLDRFVIVPDVGQIL